MCVILFKPKGVKLPSLDILTKAHNRNPHGCGFCSPTGSYKGLSFNSFLREVKKHEDEPILIHFRFATQGSVKKSNCHPFYDEETNTYFMHNGVLSGFLPHKDMTDSEMCFRWMIQPYIKRYGFSVTTEQEVEYQRCGSRFAFMQGEDVHLYGLYEQMDGVYYSNLRFL